MTGLADTKHLSRRSVIRIASAAAAASLKRSYVSDARAAGQVESAIEWARSNLPNSAPDIINDAAKEAKLSLTLYNLGGDDKAIRGLIDAFRRHYPFIGVSYDRQDTTQLLIKFNAEVNARRGITDYLMLPGNIPTSRALVNRGAIMKFVVSQDEAFKEGKNSGFWYPWRGEKATTVYRAGAISADEAKLIRTYQGLGNSRFKGRLGTVSVNNSVCVTAAYSMMYGPNPQTWTGIARNRPRVRPSSLALVNSVMAGEVDIGVLCGSSAPLVAAKSGAPIAFGTSSPTPTLYTFGAISALAPHPNAAKLWQDWFTSAEGQNTWVRVSGLPAVRNDISEKGWAEKQPWHFTDRSSSEFDWDAFTKKQDEVIRRFTKDIQGG